MLPALLAAKPLIKYGVMIGVPVAAFLLGLTIGHFRGEAEVYEEWDASNAQQAAKNVQEVVKADVMASEVGKIHEQATQELKQKETAIKRKAAQYAKSKPDIPLSPVFVDLYDELRRMSNEAGRRVPSTDPGAGAPEVPSGEVRTATAQVVQVQTDDGEIIELTTEELYQAVTDAFVKLGEAKKDYSGFDQWNEGREQLELDRLKPN